MSTEYMRNLIALMENSTSAKSKKSKNLFESDDLDPEFIAHVNSIAASHGSSNEMLDEDDEDFPGSSMHPIHDPSIDIDHPDFEKHINDYSNKTLAARAAKNQSSVPNHTFNGTHYVNNENPGIKVHPDDNSVSVHQHMLEACHLVTKASLNHANEDNRG